MRPRLLLALSVSLSACNAPALANFTMHMPSESESTSTGETSSSSSSSGIADSSSSTSSTTGTAGGSSGANSTTDAPPDTSSTTTSGGSSTTSTSGPEPVCGDGVVAGDEECDDQNLDDIDRCANDCTKNRWAFASAAYDHQGDLGGIDKADSLCRQYALQSGRADDSWTTFVAWLSDADHDVRDRLYPGRGRYVRTDGVAIAVDIHQLYSGTLNAPLNIDEHGAPAPGGALTGTRPDGTAAPGTHCQNWTTKSPLDFSAHTGSTGVTHGGWTMDADPETNPTGCIIEHRLYCFEGA